MSAGIDTLREATNCRRRGDRVRQQDEPPPDLPVMLVNAVLDLDDRLREIGRRLYVLAEMLDTHVEEGHSGRKR